MIVLASQERVAPGDAGGGRGRVRGASRRRSTSARSRPGWPAPARARSRWRWPRSRRWRSTRAAGRAGARQRFAGRGRRPALRQAGQPRRGGRAAAVLLGQDDASCISAAAIARDGAIACGGMSTSRALQVRELSDEFIDAYLDAEWPAVSRLRRRVPDRGPGVQLFERDRGQPFHHARPAAAAGARRAARAGGAAGDEHALCRGDRRSDRAVEIAGDPRLLARQARASSATIAPRHVARRRAGRLSRRARAPIRTGAAATSPCRTSRRSCRCSTGSIRWPSAIGAVNTVVRDADGALIGNNTDAAGFLEPLRPLLAEQHLFRMARVLGTGGAARAIVAALAGEGFVHRAGRARSGQGARAARRARSRRRAPRGRPRALRRADRLRLRRPRGLLRPDRQRQPAGHGGPAAARAST